MFLSSRPSFCRMGRTSCTMDGFCLLYLLMILLMRSGDVETNPGPDIIVREEEFIKLSKLIEPSYYKEVGVNLDIPNAELGQIIVQHLLNTTDALVTVFTRWRDRQPPGTDIRTLLAEGLERSDLGSLSGELLAGSLVPKRKGLKRRAPATATLEEPMAAARAANYPTDPRTHEAFGLGTDLKMDRTFDRLSKHMPAKKYTSLCTGLGIEFNEANNILLQFNNDYQRATRSCLADWKTRTGGNMAELKTILHEIEAGDLAKYII